MRGPNEKTLAKLVGVNSATNVATGQDDPARVGAGGRIYAILEGADGQRYGKRFSTPLSPSDIASADAFRKAFQRSGYSGMYELDESSLAGQNLPWHTGPGDGDKAQVIVKPECGGAITSWLETARFSNAKDGMTEAERVELLSLTPLGRATLALEAKEGRPRPSAAPPARLSQADLDSATAALGEFAKMASLADR